MECDPASCSLLHRQCCEAFLSFANLTGDKRYLSTDLICIFLIMSMAEHLSYALEPSVFPSRLQRLLEYDVKVKSFFSAAVSLRLSLSLFVSLLLCPTVALHTWV